MSEFERSLIQERVRAGLRNAVARGVRLGRPKRNEDSDETARLRASGASWREVSEQMGVGVGTAVSALQQSLQKPHGIAPLRPPCKKLILEGREFEGNWQFSVPSCIPFGRAATALCRSRERHSQDSLSRSFSMICVRFEAVSVTDEHRGCGKMTPSSGHSELRRIKAELLGSPALKVCRCNKVTNRPRASLMAGEFAVTHERGSSTHNSNSISLANFGETVQFCTL
jgi:hypothetical protein